MEKVIKEPKHPYTRLLVNSIPHPDTRHPWGGEDLGVGDKSDDADEPVAAASDPDDERGCVFAGRCPHVTAECRQRWPSLLATDADRATACHLYSDSESLSGERLAAISCGG